MSPLRRQLEDELAIRGMSERTRETYVSALATLVMVRGCASSGTLAALRACSNGPGLA